MQKIFANIVIIAFTMYHPVNAAKITGSDAMKIWQEGEVQAREGVTKALILYEKNLHLCYLYMGDDKALVSDCYNPEKEITTKTDEKEITTKTDEKEITTKTDEKEITTKTD